jgi:hypothetical protein
MHDLREMLRAIEQDLDMGSYQPGPWAAFLREAQRHPPEERAALAADVTRVSNKLHQRNGYLRAPAPLALVVELAAAALGLALLRTGIQREQVARVWAAAAVLSFTLQPLVKVASGSLLGIRYAYVFLVGGEPRFKMRYGSYLVLPPWKRALFHSTGMVGGPLSFWLVGKVASLRFPRTAAVCRVLFWLMALLQVVLFLGGLFNAQRPPLLKRMAHESSGGRAGSEIREGLSN